MKKKNRIKDQKKKRAQARDADYQSNDLQHESVSAGTTTSYNHTGLKDTNVPYIETGRKFGVKEPELIRFFMTDPVLQYRAPLSIESVVAFCPHRFLQDIESGNLRNSLGNVALVDDWTENGASSAVSCNSFGPVNEWGLYRIVWEKAMMNSEQYDRIPESNAIQRKQPLPQQYQSSRLLIFITNLNPWSLAALVAAATVNQAWGLRTSFHRYITFQSFMGEVLPDKRLPLFQFAFDLPYYAFTTALPHRRPTDEREKREGVSLREVIGLEFLSRSRRKVPPTELDCLCQAHISFLMIGTSESNWTAYLIADNYFQSDDRRESADQYQQQRQTFGDGSCIDALSGGKFGTDIAALSPRGYFLFVYEARLYQITHEWELLVREVRFKIEDYIKKCPFINMTKAHPADCKKSPASWPDPDPITRTIGLLNKLADTLKTTIDQLKGWNIEKISSTATENEAQDIWYIRQHTKSLERHLHGLLYLRQTCEDYKDSLASVSDRRAKLHAKESNDKAGFAQCLNFATTGLVNPMSTAATVLSMQPSAIPSQWKVNGTSFILLVLAIMALNWSFAWIFMKRQEIKSLACDLFQKKCGKDLEHQNFQDTADGEGFQMFRV